MSRPGRFRFLRTRRRTGPDLNSARSMPYMTGNAAQSPGNTAGNTFAAALQTPPIVVLCGQPGLLEVASSLVIVAVWSVCTSLRRHRDRA